MRDILFRGKRVDNGEWSHGSLVCWKTGGGVSRYDIFSQGLGNGVIPSTVGQYTGLDDKDGRRIFEGDIVKCDLYYTASRNPQIGLIRTVAFVDGRFVATRDQNKVSCGANSLGFYSNAEVIGNVHDNPELIMEAK